MGDICRICLVNNIDGIDIFADYKNEFNLREIIYELTLVEISPCNSLPRTTCQICADKLVDFHIFSLMLLESQNELLAAEEALSVNLPDATAKLSVCGMDDDDIEIDEMVLELFSRLHENDPPCEQEVTITNSSPDSTQTNITAGRENETEAHKWQGVSIPENRASELQSMLQENDPQVYTRKDETKRLRRRTSRKVNKRNDNVQEESKQNSKRTRNARTKSAAAGVEIISQEVIKDGVTSGSNNSANEIVRIELSFVDRVDQDSVSSSTTPRVYICDVCHKNFPVAGRFLAHFRRVHLKSLYKKQAKCPYCPRYFTTIVGHSNMNRHVRLVHKKLGKQPLANSLPLKTVSCKKCGEKYEDSTELYEHTKSHDDNMTETPEGFNLRCDSCQQMCESLEKFTLHMKGAHLAQDSSIKPFKCRWCGIRLRKVQGLYSHIRTKHNPNMNTFPMPRAPKRKSRYDKCQCDTCGRWMSSPAALALHCKSHATSKIFSCRICTASFKYQSSLLMHLDKHTTDRKYKCYECGDSFSRTTDLKSHMKTHGIGIQKLHKCSICTKQFRFKEHLTVHMWTHTREHPFECSLCTKAFTRKINLEEHMKTHK